tara:strand:+ start:6490 stop:6654 length:165 start_codon:yes stop_codon:yes gene_type:complete
MKQNDRIITSLDRIANRLARLEKTAGTVWDIRLAMVLSNIGLTALAALILWVVL